MSTPSKADALFSSGRKYYSEKSYGKALEEWELALEIYKREGEKRKAGIVSTSIGRALRGIGRYKAALVSCTQAVRILREVNDQAALQQALLTMGRVLEALGHYEEESRALSQAADIHLPEEESNTRIGLLIEVGAALTRVGRFSQSRSRYEEAITLARKTQNQKLLTDALSAYAYLLQQLNEHTAAEKTLQQLVQLLLDTADPALVMRARLGFIATYIAEKRFREAEALVKEAQNLFRKVGDKSGEAFSYYHRANLLLANNQPNEALSLGEQALRFFQKGENIRAQAQTCLLLGQIYGELDQERSSLSSFDKAIELFAEVREQEYKIQTHRMKGKTLLRLGKLSLAEKEFQQVLHYYQEQKFPNKVAWVHLEIAEIMNEMSEFSKAREQVKLALQQLEHVDDEEAEILGYRLLLEASQKANLLAEDIPILREGLERAEAQEKRALTSSLSIGLALATIDTKPPDQVIGIFEKAIHDEQLPIEQRAQVAMNLGALLMKEEKFSEAAQQIDQAIQLFGTQPVFNKSKAFYQLSEAYRQLNQPVQRKAALEGALESVSPEVDEVLRAQIYLDLAPLIISEDSDQAIQYYEQAAKIFDDWEEPLKRFNALLGGATLLANKYDPKAVTIAETALKISEELSVPLDTSMDSSPSFAFLQRAVEVAIYTATQRFSKQKDLSLVEKLIDWSTRRKATRLQPFLADNLGIERCAELSKLLDEERQLIKQASSIRTQLTQIPKTHLTSADFQGQRTALRGELDEVLSKIDVNRNVIAAACPDPGRGLPPQDYKMLQKLIALMPQDRRWIIINYDVLEKENRIIVSMVDHIGRYGNYTLPISPDLGSIVAKLQSITTAQNLPTSVELRDLGGHLYRSLVPSLLARELSSHTYGYIHVVTDDFLNHIPFEFLYDGQEYWGLKYPLSWSPDLQFFESTLKAKALAQASTPSVILGVNTSPAEKVSRKELAEEIAKSFLASVPTTPQVSEPIVLFGQDFTRTLMASALDQPRSLVYLSTPTKIHHRKGEITLTHPDSFRAIELGVRVNFEGAPIIILDEAVKIEPRKDGLSLTAFLRHLITAGAASIVFSRWLPNPKLQPQFTIEAVRRLYEGDPIAVVLLHTRRKLASLIPSPQSWLAYTLCGNPFSTLF